MRYLPASVALAVLGSGLAGPAHAQTVQMWCYAEVGDGVDASRYYSAIFQADAADREMMAGAFQSAVEDEQLSAVSVKATCMAASSASEAKAARDAAMDKQPGQDTGWSG